MNRGEGTSRPGRHAVAGKTVSSPAITILHIRNGKIAEEWVNRDELGMLIELGVLTSARSRSDPNTDKEPSSARRLQLVPNPSIERSRQSNEVSIS